MSGKMKEESQEGKKERRGEINEQGETMGTKQEEEGTGKKI